MIQHTQQQNINIQTLEQRVPVVLLQSPHQVPAALNVAPLDVGVQTGAQGELKRLAGDGLRRAVHNEVASGETLVEVTLLQVQPEGRAKTRED